MAATATVKDSYASCLRLAWTPIVAPLGQTTSTKLWNRSGSNCPGCPLTANAMWLKQRMSLSCSACRWSSLSCMARARCLKLAFDSAYPAMVCNGKPMHRKLKKWIEDEWQVPSQNLIQMNVAHLLWKTKFWWNVIPEILTWETCQHADKERHTSLSHQTIAWKSTHMPCVPQPWRRMQFMAIASIWRKLLKNWKRTHATRDIQFFATSHMAAAYKSAPLSSLGHIWPHNILSTLERVSFASHWLACMTWRAAPTSEPRCYVKCPTTEPIIVATLHSWVTLK